MAVKRRNAPCRAYGLDNALQDLAPLTIVSTRAPATNDIADIGTQWINKTTNAVYVLTSIVAGSATWSTSPASGATTLASLIVTTTTNLQGAATLDDTLAVTGDTTLGNVSVGGTLSFTGDLDLSSAALIDITSTLNAAPSIYLRANGGTSEQVKIHSDQGTSASSVLLLSDVGGITLTATGLTSADAINLEANAGGIDIDAAGLIAVTSTRNNAQAILLEATVGGIDILASGAAAGEDIDIVATGSSVNISSTENAAAAITLTSNGGTSETIVVTNTQGTDAASINLVSSAGGITLTSNLATADGINLNAVGGGVDIDGALQVNIASAQAAAASSVRIVASAADGGIDIDAGTGGITIDSTGAFSIDGAAASNVTTTGAGIDLTLSSVLGSVLVSSTEDAALAIRLHANGGTNETIQIHSDQGTGVSSVGLLSDVGGITVRATGLASADAINLEAAAGGIDMDSALQTNITSSQAAATALRLNASDAAGGIDIDCGTGGIAIDSTGAFSIDGAAASNITTTGAGIDLTLSSVLGSVLVSSTENTALAIRLHANAGTSETIQIHSDQGTGVGSINLLSDVGGITLTATGLASADAINLEATAGGIDADAALQINVTSSQDAADAIRILASAGGIDIDAVGAAGQDIVITNTGGSASIVATEATADAIVLNASDAAGGIDLLTGGGEITISSAGNVSMAPATATVAGTSLTNNGRVTVSTFTGLTTAAGSTETLTITNSSLGAGDGVFCTVSNRGSNDAQMSLTRVNTQTAGSLVVQAKNLGAAACNGDIIVTAWIIN